MNFQKIFRSNFIATLKNKLKAEAGIDAYLGQGIAFADRDLLVSQKILALQNIKLEMPDSRPDFEFENSKKIFEAYKTLSPVEASDERLWTYLAHVTFWDYMKARRPVSGQPQNSRESYILDHWFVDKISTAHLLRNDISLLWWASFLTYDEQRGDPYELTREVFTMLDYTRHLLPGTQGRNRIFLHAILEFICENRDLFSAYKEGKVRFIMRTLNYVAGYRVLPTLSKEETKALLNRYRTQLQNFKPE